MAGTEAIAILVSPLEFPYAPVPLKSEPSKQLTATNRFQRCSCSPLCWALLCLLLMLLVGGGIAAGVLVSRKQDTTTTISTPILAAMTTTTATTTTTTTVTTTTTTATTTTTTVTTTTATTTTTTATTATTTAATTTNSVPLGLLYNNCTTIVNNPQILVYLSNRAAFSYTYYQYSYVATSSNTTMMFVLRQDPSYWCLDDISVMYNGIQWWRNGGFELSPLTLYYTYCNPNFAAASGVISSSYPHSGTYSFYDGSVTYSDYLSQSFATVVGGSYTISFWLRNLGNPVNSFLVLIG